MYMCAYVCNCNLVCVYFCMYEYVVSCVQTFVMYKVNVGSNRYNYNFVSQADIS